MVLCVAGNVTPDEVLSVADRLLKPQKPIQIERKFHREPREVAESYTEETLSVAFPIFSLGFKEAVETPERSLREILISDIILEAVAGKTSAFYSELLEAGLINTSFESEYFCGYGYAAWIFTGESPDGRECKSASPRAFVRCRKAVFQKRTSSASEKNFTEEASCSLTTLTALQTRWFRRISAKKGCLTKPKFYSL